MRIVMTVAGGFRGVLLVALAVACIAGRVEAGATAQEVNKAIDKAKEFLYSQQKNGHWDKAAQPTVEAMDDIDATAYINGGQFGGLTALVAHALLAAGESPTDARLAPAIAFLQGIKMRGVYATAERLQVYSYMPRTPAITAAIKKDAEALIAGMGDGDIDGLFKYLTNRAAMPKLPVTFDMSASNYGALGIWAAAESGYEVPTSVWRRIDAGWRKYQTADGGWAYRPVVGSLPTAKPDQQPKFTLTAAGIATLNVTQDYIGRSGKPGSDASWSKPAVEDVDIRNGMDWLTKNWTKSQLRYDLDCFRYYGLYNLERAALASGRRFFGDIDWYESGAAYLLKVQKPDGAIPVLDTDARYVGSVGNTAFAMIFLAYGRAPVVLNKLEYELAVPDHDRRPPTTKPSITHWNQNPRDAARFTKWLGIQTERKLSWQIVDLKRAPVYLHDAPILYVTGKQALRFTEAEESVLRRYAEDGGLILANAETGSPAFTESFKKLGSKLFPTYEFRELPPSHPIHTRGQFSFRDRKPTLRLLGLSNGSRELMLLVSAGDISKSWELNLWQARADSFQVSANIFHYATDRNNPRERGDSYIVLPDPAIVTNRKIEVARLKYNGNWDPEPGGWRRLVAVLRNSHKVELVCKTVTLGAGELKGMKVAHLTGTTKLTLADAARDELRQFIEGGGMLIIDAAGGSIDFRDTIRDQLGQLVPAMDQLPAPLPASHPLYTLAGNEIKKFAYRRAVQELPGGTAKVPRLRGIEVNGRLAIFYSDEDLSTGLVGQHVGGIIGYAPESATAIMRNMLLSIGQKPGPATR